MLWSLSRLYAYRFSNMHLVHHSTFTAVVLPGRGAGNLQSTLGLGGARIR